MVSKRKPLSDDEIEVTLPFEERRETRVAHGHTYSEWKFKLQWYNHRCAYCGIRKEDTPQGYLTRDHLIPIIHNGTDKIENIVPACKKCNWIKGTEAPGHTVGQPRVRKRRSHGST